MPNPYELLVKKVGIEAAKEEMRRRRGLVKNHPGGSFRSKDFAKEQSLKGVAARKLNYEALESEPKENGKG